MSRTAYLKAQLAAALRLGEPRAVRRLLRALDGCLPPWVVAELCERLGQECSPYVAITPGRNER